MEKNEQAGFTIVETIVTLVVLSLFLTLFFQMYLTSESQRIAVLRRSAANDIAMSNLKKISSKAVVPAGQSCANGGGTIPWSASLTTEPTDGTLLPPGTQTVQTLSVSYPYGCGAAQPAKITSTVSYSGGSETITRAELVN